MKTNYTHMFPDDGCLVDESLVSPKMEVMGLYAATTYFPQDGEICISIRASGNRVPTLSPNFQHVLYLEFDDTAVDDMGAENPQSINEAQAASVAQFVTDHTDATKIVVHCFAGVSRSRSMAAAISDHLKLPYKWTVLNPHVFETVSKEFEHVSNIGRHPREL